MRRGLVVTVFGALSLVTAMLLAGHGPWAGHVIWAVDAKHGLNSGDLLPLALWLVGAGCCAALWWARD